MSVFQVLNITEPEMVSGAVFQRNCRLKD